MPRPYSKLVSVLGSSLVAMLLPSVATAQIDQALAERYFAEAKAACEREAGALWGVSLCGPMVFADPISGEIATNQAAPDAPRPRALGYANAAMPWGEERWSTFVWPMLPRDDQHRRVRLMLHELFHRVQPSLDLITPDGRNDHLDTLEGRYWLQLEWRALTESLESEDEVGRLRALSDALAFRRERHLLFPEAVENERREEIREGLAQYTATVAAVDSEDDAVADAVDQMKTAPERPTLVRTFAYVSGPAYGLLLDAFAPGWRKEVDQGSALVEVLREVASVEPTGNVQVAASRHRGDALRVVEERRERDRVARVAALRRRFVEDPVMVVPRGRNASFVTTGSTPVPGAGTTLASYRVTGPWGSLEAETVLVSVDEETLVLPAPVDTTGPDLAGDGWTIELATGWTVRAGPRDGDYRVAEEE